MRHGRRRKEFVMSSMTSAATYEYPVLGYVPMPENFRYKDVILRGRPCHDPGSRFRIKHPKMPCSRRAKIFAPFDALRGFNEAVASKEIFYTERPELSEDEKEQLNNKLAILHKLTINRKEAKKNAPLVKVTFYQPCLDELNDSYGKGGTLETITGICRRVDAVVTCTITIEDQVIALDDIVYISVM